MDNSGGDGNNYALNRLGSVEFFKVDSDSIEVYKNLE